MGVSREELLARALLFAQQRAIAIEQAQLLGSGIDGTVWATNRKSALKVHERQTTYLCERDVYRRLAVHRVSQIHSFNVPELVGCDDELLIVEMTIVTAPYILDFAKCYLDRRPDFSPEVLAETKDECEELFGDDWVTVRRVLARLEGLGVWYVDASPRNIQVHGT